MAELYGAGTKTTIKAYSTAGYDSSAAAGYQVVTAFPIRTC
ncbi:protein of unknown function [Maridesulfovibrio hydrothermalis AM13 = DSM 14728]|uniref:Uncharacterized protein n=1 Tax=Maridesulfovibrio hydrothermalis AM13 = DSM 14728 TaxID=1121451 RepID=L0RDF0_9BACT|nr:protein of unknown function [Maridesulfovibrio hydrothermalis AM13 = DSM 14728]